MNDINIGITQIKIGKMLGEYKEAIDDDYIELLLVDYLAFTAMVIEDLINEGKIKLC